MDFSNHGGEKNYSSKREDVYWMFILISWISILLMLLLHLTIKNEILKCGEFFKSLIINHGESYDLL
jgi:hypothetical protein